MIITKSMPTPTIASRLSDATPGLGEGSTVGRDGTAALVSASGGTDLGRVAEQPLAPDPYADGPEQRRGVGHAPRGVRFQVGEWVHRRDAGLPEPRLAEQAATGDRH